MDATAGDALLDAVRHACRDEPRPEHFANHHHCCECAEHDATLLASDPETIGLEQLGHASWDPICFITPAGFRYYLPALTRLALGRRDDYYLGQFLFHLNSGRIDDLNAEQRAAVLALLEHVYATMRDEVEAAMDRHALEAAILKLLA